MKQKRKLVAKKATAKKAAVVDVTRKIPDFTRLLLFVRSGGHCQFDGCVRYLLEHHVTLTEGNFAQMAHIVAFSKAGPRGNTGRPENINSVDNLMSLCPGCHKLIDDNPELYSKGTLTRYKKEHERRIRHLTGLKPEMKTSVLVVKSKIGVHTVSVPFDQILEAVSPRYPHSKDSFVIDLTQLSADSPSFLAAACDAIKNDLKTFFGPSGEYKKTGHISLFAFAPIPVLAFLGSQLSNKVSTELFQRHRDKENWTWKKSRKPVQFVFRKTQAGKETGKVALALSLSGAINFKGLPSEIDDKFTIYEITIGNQAPNPGFLKAKIVLEEFRAAYQQALGVITTEHKGISSISLFPAVPAPIAVLCGRELLPKVHPELRIYDNDKNNRGFTYQITINNI